ncbi:MAG: hypothetical protein KHY89_02250 [Butyricicoccus pullicaecorum]|nr:hypothetical protein [Butyricicoccus pullicaecorum]
MKHIFLTGQIQCGKSTLIQSILRNSTGKLTAAGGFLTYFTCRDPVLPHSLYLGNAVIYGDLFGQSHHSQWVSPVQLHQSLIAQDNVPIPAAEFSGNTHPKIFLDAFNISAKVWIEQGLKNAQTILRTSRCCPILIFDECGYLEANATAFHQAVYHALDMPIPILGVLRHMTTTSWLDLIRSHPSVQLISVTPSNRDTLVPQLTDELLSSF